VNGESIAVLGTLPTYSTLADQSSLPAAYMIDASGGFATNYAFQYLGGTLTVQQSSFHPISIPAATIDDTNHTTQFATTLHCTRAASASGATLSASCGSAVDILPEVLRSPATVHTIIH
jgi:hypothetical protein